MRYQALLYLSLCALVALMGVVGTGHMLWVLASVVLVLPVPVIVYGLWTIKRAAWVALHLHAVLVFGVSLFIAGRAPPLAFIAVIMALCAAGISILFLRRDARMPYLAHDLRGFRRFERFRRAMPATVVRDGYRIRGESFDISDGGAYLVLDPRDFQAGQRVSVELQGRDGAPVIIAAKVVSENDEGVHGRPRGVGVRFVDPAPAVRDGLQRLIHRSRHHQRVSLCLPVRVQQGRRTLSTATHDMSVSGCFVTSSDLRLKLGDRVTLTISLHERDTLEIVAEVVWRREIGHGSQPAGIALRYMQVTPAQLERLRSRLFEKDAPSVETFV